MLHQERAVAILPESMRAELGPLLQFACRGDLQDVPEALADDPDAWRVRRRVQRALVRESAATEAARREAAVRRADPSPPEWSRTCFTSAHRSFNAPATKAPPITSL